MGSGEALLKRLRWWPKIIKIARKSQDLFWDLVLDLFWSFSAVGTPRSMDPGKEG